MTCVNNSGNILEHFPNVCGTTLHLQFFSYLATKKKKKKKKLEFCSEDLCYNYLYNLLQLHTVLRLTSTISNFAQMAVNV